MIDDLSDYPTIQEVLEATRGIVDSRRAAYGRDWRAKNRVSKYGG